MHHKNRRVLGILLMIMISLSGMYFGNGKAGSFPECAPMFPQDSFMETTHVMVGTTQVCTMEMLGGRSAGNIKLLPGRPMPSRGEWGISLDFLCLNNQSLQEGKFFTGSEITQIRTSCWNGLVTDYIHNSDGKKRIEW